MQKRFGIPILHSVPSSLLTHIGRKVCYGLKGIILYKKSNSNKLNEAAVTKDTNSIAKARFLIKNVLLSPLKLLSYIASFYAFLLENIKVGLGDYWFDFELEKIRLKKQTISHLQNSENSTFASQ